ncbi:MAG: hypothetical protein V2I36_17605 [Desulfopila sp.]|jgi:hypothetical protein|nr:hypothetical protein [Desulfopila sp.]
MRHRNLFQIITLSSLIFLGGFCLPPAVFAVEEHPSAAGRTTASAQVQESACQEIITLLQEQDKKTQRELGRIKREIALLNQQLDKPGISEMLGGIGYIFGLFGLAAYVASRKKKDRGEH